MVRVLVPFSSSPFLPFKTSHLKIKHKGQSSAPMLAKLIVPKGNKQFEGWTSIPLVVFGLVSLPIIGAVGAFYVNLTKATFWFSSFYWVMNGVGILVGYHRYWSHRSFNASLFFQYVIAIFGAAACEGSIMFWAREHRAHHRYTDTNRDPYNATFGLFWSHVGWTMVRPPSGGHRSGWVDIEDLKNDKVVRWQHRHYVVLAILMGLVVPTIIPGYLWGDWKGGFVYSTVIRMVLVHHSTFSVNSLAHWWGDKNFDDKHTPVDSNNPLLAFITGGESYHNFHHQFPMDYRNGVKWYHYDPVKWLIWGTSKIGLTSHLKTFPENEIQKAEFTMKLKNLAKVQDKLKWPKNGESLPIISLGIMLVLSRLVYPKRTLTANAILDKKHAEAQSLILIGGFIHDVSQFLDEHPGGAKVVQSFIGKDSTSAFFGGVYDHSNAAHNLLAMRRVGVLWCGYETGGPEVKDFVPPSQRLMITTYEQRVEMQCREKIPFLTSPRILS
ncbi:Acyl-CoA desaturase [Mycena venus]|uniref:Acyl-CoA desaturase n=1 Tax=Mycena venus TaxID=2733690 RepID=A0A8H6U3T5_9AGAR|nr:Acyl-CoA desaturase [Mycena venus]